MNEVQKIQLRQSELRSDLSKELAKDEKDTDILTNITKELEKSEIELRAAIVLHGDNSPQNSSDEGEKREFDDILSKASVADYLSEAVNPNFSMDGASRELREAVFGEDKFGFMPMHLLQDDVEERADAVTNIATAIQENQMSIAARVFARSAMGYLGISTPSVPVGTVTYPRLVSGTTADVRDPSVELDGAKATLESVSINPVRLTASYTFTLESLAKIQGFEEALRNDLRAVISDQSDDLAINGQAAVANTSPAVAGLVNSLADPTDPSGVADWESVFGLYDAHVDGFYAVSDEEVRMLVNPLTWRHVMGLQVETSGALMRDVIDRSRFRTSAHLPASGGNVETGLTYAAGASGLARGLIMPTWDGIQIIDDPYTRAKAGERVITAIVMQGWNMVDDAAYKRVEFKLK